MWQHFENVICAFGVHWKKIGIGVLPHIVILSALVLVTRIIEYSIYIMCQWGLNGSDPICFSTGFRRTLITKHHAL